LRLLDEQVVLIDTGAWYHDLVCPFIDKSTADVNRVLSGKSTRPILCKGQGDVFMNTLGAEEERRPDGVWVYEKEIKLLLEVGNMEPIGSLFNSIDEYFKCLPTVNAVVYLKIGGTAASRREHIDSTNVIIGVVYREGLAGTPKNCAVSFGGVGKRGLNEAIVSTVVTKTSSDQFTGVGRPDLTKKFSIHGGVFFEGCPDLQVDLADLYEEILTNMKNYYS
jgi:hypothetical protein